MPSTILPILRRRQLFFAEVRRVLQLGGHLLFDITTEYASREWFADVVDHQECQEADVIRHSWYDEQRRLQHNRFRFYLPTVQGSWQRYEEDHCQRIYGLGELQAMVEAVGLRWVAAYDSFGFGAPTKNSLRVHVIIKRE